MKTKMQSNQVQRRRATLQKKELAQADQRSPLAQLKGFPGGDRISPVQRMEMEEFDEDAFQMKAIQAPIQRMEADSMPNNTGLPDNLKSGIESLSGYSMDDVQVHYNSSKPATLQAHAYAQGTDIHLGPGQEKHLPHEAWHVVQQKQGRVKPTMQMQGMGVNINDDVGLEREADVMGAKANG